MGGAIENKELPFVLGVLGDFSGQPEEPLPRVRDRKLIEIDRDNFDQVLAAMKPRSIGRCFGSPWPPLWLRMLTAM